VGGEAPGCGRAPAAMDDLLREFLTETVDNLNVAGVELVRFERDPREREPLDRIFRIVHTLKGSCGFLKLPRLETLAHACEGLLGRFRDEAFPATSLSVSLVFESLDRVRAILVALDDDGREPAGDDMDLIARIATLSAKDAPPVPNPAKPAVGKSGPAARPASDRSIRVGSALLDDLMRVSGELVRARDRLAELAGRRGDAELARCLAPLIHAATELQHDIRRTRQQPVGEALAVLPRLIRELESKLGKKLTLCVDGVQTGLDRRVLDLVQESLTHMVRNAADHGIEPPAERVAVGKPEMGTISVGAVHEGGDVVIAISDDGRGLDLAGVRAKAVEKGFVPAEKAGALDDRDIARFIFHPGFSTAARVTKVSGRGVGLDVVRDNVERIGGAIDFTTERGRGTRFTIRIPLALSVTQILVVSAGEQRFAIAQRAVTQILSMEHARQSGEAMPLVVLADVLALGRQAPAPSDAAVLVMSAAGVRFGLCVDAVRDAQEIEVSPLPSVMRGEPLYAGCTILGDGDVALVLDPNGLADCARPASAREAGAAS